MSGFGSDQKMFWSFFFEIPSYVFVFTYKCVILLDKIMLYLFSDSVSKCVTYLLNV